MATEMPTHAPDAYRAPPASTGWVGWIKYASVMLFVVAFFHMFTGFVALFREDYYLVPKTDLVIAVDYTAWGWAHLGLGILVACTSAALMTGATWARVITIVIAVISSLVNLAFMSAYPLWSAFMIAANFLVIYAVAVHGDPETLADY